MNSNLFSEENELLHIENGFLFVPLYLYFKEKNAQTDALDDSDCGFDG